MFRFCLLLIPVLLTACGPDSGGDNTAATGSASSVAANDAPPAGDFYKRFSGTVAGKPVVVHLHRQGTKVYGTYQYVAVGQVIVLRNWADTLADDEYLLSEMVPGADSDGATWAIRIRGAAARGEWQGSSGQTPAPIELTENYPDGSTRLDAFYIADSAALIPDRPSSPKAVTTYSYVLPAGAQKGFHYDMLRRQVAPHSREGDDVLPAIRAENAAYFEQYRRDNAALFGGQDDGDASLFALGYTMDEVVSVLYNDDHWLVTEMFSSSYTGGAHGNYGSSYANIDLQGQRLWQVTDMVGDTTALRPMLNDAAIAYFHLQRGEGIGERLLVSEVPATGNVYLSSTGLSFVYNPYEIASYAAGQISLFLPYKKLMPFLTPAFKARMKLTERAGVAMLSVQP